MTISETFARACQFHHVGQLGTADSFTGKFWR
jgi:hypothetical protein